jgi:hypothetical protein
MLAAFVALGTAACGGSGSSSSADTNGMLPSAGVPSSAAVATTAAPAARGAPTQVAGFTFPAGFTVRFDTQLPSDSAKRAVVQALESQQAGLVYALYVKQGDKGYLKWTEGGAGSFQSLVTAAESGHLAGRGVIAYSSIKLTSKIYSFPAGAGTSGTFCLDTSGAHGYNTATSATVAPALPSGFYLFSMHKDPGATWKVAALQKEGSASCGG